MNKSKLFVKSVSSIVLTAAMALSTVACGETNSAIKTITKEANKTQGEYTGKTVILHSNDTHGAVEGFAFMEALKAQYEADGATVILVDDGDFTQGSTYVSLSKGLNAVELMDKAGYDIVALGNHEFDYGYDQLVSNFSKASFLPLCSDVFKDGKTIFDSEVIVKVGDLKIGFFALETPETQTKVNPGLIKGLSFVQLEELYKLAQDEADLLHKSADLVFCLGHLGVDLESVGNRSVDVLNHVNGIDFFIDGHSHTVMSYEGLQSTGTAFANVGYVVVDNKTKTIESNGLISTENIDTSKTATLKEAQKITSEVDEKYNAPFASTEVFLNGTKAYVRSQETNLGDLIADSMVWNVLNAGAIEVDADHVVGVTNGGGIRADINEGTFSMNDVFTVLPFGNTIAVDYITGAELLEALEASTYCTPSAVGGFPQVAGIEFTIDTSIEFDAGELYPESTYNAPKSIKRVTINSINGKAFDSKATYAVVTNNFTAAGGDTYYSFKRAYDAGNGFDTSIPLDEGLKMYIEEELGGKVTSKYAEAQGRIIIK